MTPYISEKRTITAEVIAIIYIILDHPRITPGLFDQSITYTKKCDYDYERYAYRYLTTILVNLFMQY